MAMTRPVVSVAILLAFALPAYAVEQPVPGRADERIRYVNYDPGNVVEIWSTPGAVMAIEFAEGEQVADVAASDSHTLVSGPRDNFLFLKFRGCLLPEPVIVLTRNQQGKLRRYDFQVETRPQVCPDQPGGNTVRASAGDPPIVPGGNLKYISHDALAAGADVSYTTKFLYPGDEAAKRRAAAAKRKAVREKEKTARLLRQQTEFSTRDPYSGNRNYRYAARGDAGLTPRRVFDNGYSTAFVFPDLQRVPALFRLDPDGKEATADYSLHGDTVIANGTAQEWRLRDGGTVLEVWDLGYNPAGATPDTGTASAQVERVLKGADDAR